MGNEICKKKTTAPDTSVGADDGQPLRNSTENSISTFDEEINGDFQNSSEIFVRMICSLLSHVLSFSLGLTSFS